MSAVSQRPRDEVEAWTVPLPSRSAIAGLTAASGLFTALVYTGVIGVGWLVIGPILSLCAWWGWAEFRRRRDAHG
jgi:hypothetical protein